MRTFPTHIIRAIVISLIGPSLVAGARSNPPSPPQGPSGAIEGSPWYTQVSEDIRHGEYAFHPVTGEPGVWSAPNRSQELRSRVSRAGLEVLPRAANADGIGAPWRLSLSTKSFGRVGELRDLDLPSIRANGSRIELDHGVLREWFENGTEGIEQGWTIGARPRGVEPLWIGIQVEGDLQLRIEDSAHSGVLVDASGAVQMRYRNLFVSDATGRELCASLTSGPSGIRIQIDDAGAVYPLTVDPVLSGPAWTAESDQASAYFGYSVSTAGDVNGDGYSDVIVGAPYYDNGETDEGRAYVYLGSAAGLSTSPAWTGESNQASAYFGQSVSGAGDVNGDGYSDVIVGAPSYDNGQTDEGRAYVYLGSATGPSTSPAWTAESDQVGAYFGFAFSSAGDVNGDGYSDVIVGAHFYDNGQTDEGRAYVYLGSATGPSTSAAWTTESDQVGAGYGVSVSMAGDVNGDGYSDVIVGAYLYDNGQADEGRACVYLGSATGLSTSPVWTAESDQVNAHFGVWVSTAGDVNGDGFGDVIVGAHDFDNGQTDEGRAYVYLGSAAGLSTSPVWTAESDQASADFGFRASTAGDVNGDGYSDVIVGAPSYGNGQTNEGRAYVYLGSATGLSTSPAWTAESNQASAYFGYSVLTAGDVNGDGYSDVIVGAPYYDNGQSDEGRAYVYLGSATGLSTNSAWAAESDQAGAAFGVSVSTAGDVNGDGFSDVIVGANLFDNGETNEGRAFVYVGSATGLSTSPAWTAESDQVGARFGESVSSAGDVNGDGYGDVIVGAARFDNGETDEGRACVYLGSATGLSTSPTWTAESDQANAWFGAWVATAGDVNGDGFSDVIVGAPQFTNGETDEGRAYVYLGSASGLGASPAWTAESDRVGAAFGASVSSAGDVDGDGYSDVIVGAQGYGNGFTNAGKVYVFQGSAAGLGTSPAWTAEGAGDWHLGDRVASAGDVNGDGFSDVIVAAPAYSNGESQEGAVLVYEGSATGLSATAAWMTESNQGGANYGSGVSSAGDVNGDGYSDVIVSANSYDDPENNEGRAYLYLGSATGLSTSPAWTMEGDQDSAFVHAVSSAGDVNGDGYGDVIVGAYGFSNGQTSEGRAFVFLGNEGMGGWTTASQQRRSGDGAPISLLGCANPRMSFRIRLGLDHSLAGFRWADPRTPTARLEWQVAHLDENLGGAAIQSGTNQTISGTGNVFNELAWLPDFGPGSVPSLDSSASYHWRARLRTNNPLLPVTPWVTIPGNNVTETKLRVASRLRLRP